MEYYGECCIIDIQQMNDKTIMENDFKRNVCKIQSKGFARNIEMMETFQAMSMIWNYIARIDKENGEFRIYQETRDYKKFSGSSLTFLVLHMFDMLLDQK